MEQLCQYFHEVRHVFTTFLTHSFPVEWDSVKLCMIDSVIHTNIQNDTIATTVIVLDESHHMLIKYDPCERTWSLPYYPIDQSIKSDHEHLRISLLQNYGVSISNIRLFCVKKHYKHQKNPFQKDITKYTTIYLANLSGSFLHHEKYQNTIVMANFSQILDLPMYNEYKEPIDQIYDPLKIQLIIDIDQTLLVSCESMSKTFIQNYHPDSIVDYDTYGRRVYVWTRPHMHEFLKKMSGLTHLSYWTASHHDFQEKIIISTRIDQYTKKIHYIDNCTIIDDTIYKSISDLNNQSPSGSVYDLDRVVLVDDWLSNIMYNQNNGILIPAWDIITVNSCKKLYQCKSDNALIKLMTYIQYMSDKVIHEHMTIPQLLSRQKLI